MELGFADTLAKLRFRHRVVDLPNGNLAYRLNNHRGYVQITRAEWEEAGDAFKELTRPSRRRATILLLFSLPAYVFYIVVASALIPKEVARSFPGGVYFALFIAPLPGLPVIIYVWYSHQVKRISSAIDEHFSVFTRIEPPAPDPFPKPPFWLDLLCLIFAGPHLILAAVGSLFPGIFHNTPLTGRQIDGPAVFALGILLFRYWWHVQHQRRTAEA